MLAFGYPKENPHRTKISDFKRKSISKISDIADKRLEPARLAPSSVNSQPWFFVHEKDIIHIFCVQKGLFSKVLGDLNLIDAGISLSHIYVSNPDTFSFFKTDDASDIKGYGYVGSFTV